MTSDNAPRRSSRLDADNRINRAPPISPRASRGRIFENHAKGNSWLTESRRLERPALQPAKTSRSDTLKPSGWIDELKELFGSVEK